MRPKPRLKAPLERLYREFDWTARAQQDAIRYPLRYADPGDREVSGLLTACLAYGRVDLFGPQLGWALAQMGDSPRRFILGFDPKKDGARFDGFRYRFNRPRDLAAFCLATQRILLAHGSLGAFFAKGYAAGDPDVGPALERFVDGFLDQDLSAVFPRNRLSRGFRHLFPRPSTGGPCKRPQLVLAGALLLALGLVTWLLVGTRRELQGLQQRGMPAEGMAEMLQRQIEGVRQDGRSGQDGLKQEVGELSARVREEVGALRLAVAGELKGVTAEVTRQLQEGMRLLQESQSTMGH